MPEFKLIKIDGRDVKFYAAAQRGVGTECQSCTGKNSKFKWVSTRTAKNIKQCHCGTEYSLSNPTTSGAKPVATAANKFKGFTKSDFAEILSLAKLASDGKGPDKPSQSKPSQDDFISAIGDDEKLNDLKKIYEAHTLYETWNSSLKKPQQKSLTEAAKDFFNKD